MDLFLISTKLKNKFPIVRDRVTDPPQKAAILVILYVRNSRTYVAMIKRARHLNTHAGEIGFPGGLYEDRDRNLLTTALRETGEEVGLHLDESAIIASLPTVNTRTGYEITPFVTILDYFPRLEITSDEVEEILEIPLAPLLSTQHRDIGFKAAEEMVVFWYQHHRIWGASAKILQQIEELSVF